MSKGLDALKQLKDISYFIIEVYSNNEPLKENQRDSRQCFMYYCKNIEKELKALEIIKKKNVDIELLNGCDNVYKYNVYFPFLIIYQLTQEEFELLKEVLSDDYKDRA